MRKFKLELNKKHELFLQSAVESYLDSPYYAEYAAEILLQMFPYDYSKGELISLHEKAGLIRFSYDTAIPEMLLRQLIRYSTDRPDENLSYHFITVYEQGEIFGNLYPLTPWGSEVLMRWELDSVNADSNPTHHQPLTEEIPF